MSTTNTALTITSTANALPDITRNIVPKPTKTQLLRATARAVSRANAAELIGLRKQLGRLEARLLRLAKRQARRLFRECTGNVYGYGNERACTFGVTVAPEAMAPECKATHDEYMALHKRIDSLPTDEEYIYCELRDKANNMDAQLDALLADPRLRKQLVTAGQSILRAPANEEKTNAITV